LIASRKKQPKGGWAAVETHVARKTSCKTIIEIEFFFPNKQNMIPAFRTQCSFSAEQKYQNSQTNSANNHLKRK
jgi:hypothetical protein